MALLAPLRFSSLFRGADWLVGKWRWLIAPLYPEPQVRRFYRQDTLVLETLFSTPEGEAAVIDVMPLDCEGSHIIRRVEGRSGRVRMHMHLKLCFDYGLSVPWVTRNEDEDGIVAIAGQNLVTVRSNVKMAGQDLSTIANFEIAAGESVTFVLSYGPSHLPPPPAFDAEEALKATEERWRAWSARCQYQGLWKDAVLQSLIVLKALTYQPTGGIIAAPTTSLPEQFRGPRNWDYRFCWLRDATLTLIALMGCGYFDEAQRWSNWLHRSIAGRAGDMQIMYGVGGERQLQELEMNHLPGYQGAKPVRVGNAASGQLQLDVFGEVMDALHQARRGGLKMPASTWSLQTKLIEHLESIWRDPDDGIWEVRGGRRQFVHSKVMAWVAFDRAVQSIEQYDLPGPLARWRAARDAIHSDVCEHGFHKKKQCFTQSYGGEELDASLLMIPLAGFLQTDDWRVKSTVAAIERELKDNVFVMRYRTGAGTDGLPPGEGAFLPCSFWLADNYSLLGRHGEAKELFEKLLGLRNDVGLLAEEYNQIAHRQAGNFPQAFSHLAIVICARNLDDQSARNQRREGAKPLTRD